MTLKHYYTVNYLPERVGGARLGATLPDCQRLQYLLNDLDTSGYGILDDIDAVIKGDKNKAVFTTNSMVRATITPNDVTIGRIDVDESYTSGVDSLKPQDVKDMVTEFVRNYEEFKKMKSAKKDWHGLSTVTDSESQKETMYWDPVSDKTGYFKDLPEGKAWLEHLQRLKEGKKSNLDW